MKTKKFLQGKRGAFFFAILCAVFSRLGSFSFDGRLTPSVVDYTPTLTNGDYIWGAVYFMQGFNVAKRATVNIKVAEPIRKTINLGVLSTMNVLDSMEVFDGIIMDADSKINDQAHDLSVLNGTITATTRGYLNVIAPYGTTAYIRTYGFNLGNTTLIVRPNIHILIDWDFLNGTMGFGSSRGGDYETEYGLLFKGSAAGSPSAPLGVVGLHNANFAGLWQNSSGVPLLRFSVLNRLMTYNVRFNFVSDTTYTFSGFGWFYPDNTILDGIWRQLDFYGATCFGSGVLFSKGLATVFKNTVTLSAGPITFDSTDLTFTQTATMLWPAYTINSVVDINGQNNTPVDLRAAHYLVTPGSQVNFNDCNLYW